MNICLNGADCLFSLAEFTPLFWVLAIIATLITGISKSGFAGSMGIIAVPLLSLAISPIQAAAIMLPLMLVMDYFSVRIWWGKHDSELLWRLLPAALIGVFIGYLSFDHLNAATLKLQLGILSLAFAIWGLLKGSYLTIFTTNLAGRVFSAMAGFTSFVAHAGGPPWNAHLIPLKLPRETYLATSAVFFTSVNLVKLLPYGLLNQLHINNLFLTLVLIPIAWLGVKLGVVIQHHLNDQIFYQIILIILIVIGIKLTLDSTGIIFS